MTDEIAQLAREATRYQKRWFNELRSQAAHGTPVALINADTPQEIFRTLEIPYVINQWWASLVGSKGRAGEALDIIRQQGLPDWSRQYDAVAYGSTFLEDPPWGGLPQPTFAVAESSGDAGRKVFDLWGETPGTETFLFERTHADEAPARWWDLVPHQWDKAFEPERLNLLVEECEELVLLLEATTGRRFDQEKFSEVMDLVNEQAEWNRRSRDLIAESELLPVSVHQSINSVMIPQWHRGTTWAARQAERFYRAIESRVRNQQGLIPVERHRLMWIGRGLWHDMGFYERFQEKHRAVFVWSMYLGIAADGYARYGPDPMRQLASRFAGITDQLYMPGWAEPWYAKEAVNHRVNGAVHLVADDVPGSSLVTAALEREGIPVLEIRANNADPRSMSSEAMSELVDEFIATRLEVL